MEHNKNSTEIDILDDVFEKRWKQYKLCWCDLCDVATIICPKCRNSSCNGASCEECMKDWLEFKEYRRQIENYLTIEEKKIYNKCVQIKKHILETIPKNIKVINWFDLKNKVNYHFGKKKNFL